MAQVVFLRGVNVGGRRTFRPRGLARELSHLDAVNIGAAGTFVVRRRITKNDLREEVLRRLPFEAEIMICRGHEIRELLTREFFSGLSVRREIVRFVSVLSKRPRIEPPTPLTLPSSGRWLLKVLAREGRFLVGLHRREMRAIGYLGALDELYGAPVTTRSWSTISTIGRVLAGAKG